jgi:hypothetical protein
MLEFEDMTMEITCLEVGGQKVPLPRQGPIADTNDDIVARISEMMEQVEGSEPSCIALSTSASF